MYKIPYKTTLCILFNAKEKPLNCMCLYGIRSTGIQVCLLDHIQRLSTYGYGIARYHISPKSIPLKMYKIPYKTTLWKRYNAQERPLNCICVHGIRNTGTLWRPFKNIQRLSTNGYGIARYNISPKSTPHAIYKILYITRLCLKRNAQESSLTHWRHNHFGLASLGISSKWAKSANF